MQLASGHLEKVQLVLFVCILSSSTRPVSINSFLVSLGMETLSLRMERHVQNAQAVAEYLVQHPLVSRVCYAGLPSSPAYQYAQKYAPRGAGSVLSFDLVGGRAAGEKFVEALQLHLHVANLGDVRSLVIHPASTTHAQATPEELAASGINESTIRLSVGLEHISDLLTDLDQAFAQLRR